MLYLFKIKINKDKIMTINIASLPTDVRKKISTYSNFKDILSLRSVNQEFKNEISQNLVDIHSNDPLKNPNKITIIQNPDINLTSDDTLTLIRKGNQSVRNTLIEHRKTELNKYDLHDYMTIHNDVTADNVDKKINIICDTDKVIGHLEMRKLLEFVSLENHLSGYLNDNREKELVSLVNSDTILTDNHIDKLIEISSEASDLALVMKHNRVLSEHNILSLIYNERLIDETNTKPVCHKLLQTRQLELIENPFTIAVLAGYDDRSLRNNLLSSDLPIRQTVLNGIFEGGNPDDIQQLMQSKRLDHQWAIEPNPKHDNNLNNGAIITDNRIQGYINTMPPARRFARFNVLADQNLANRDTLQTAFNKMQHRRARQQFNQQRNVRRRIE